jgi:hypothetical protein
MSRVFENRQNEFAIEEKKEFLPLWSPPSAKERRGIVV